MTTKQNSRFPVEKVKDAAFSQINHIFESELNDFFNNAFKDWKWIATDSNSKKYSYPKIDIYDENNTTVIEAAVPGISKEDIDISFDNNVLTIRANSQSKKDRDLNSYKLKELHRSSFSRSITILEDIYDVEKIHAKVENGMLTVSVPKKVTVPKPDNVKKITVH